MQILDGKVTFIVTSDIYWNMSRWYASRENSTYAASSLEVISGLISLIDEADIASYENTKVNFELSQADYDFINQESKQMCLSLDSRIIWGGLGGNTYALGVKINGEGGKGPTPCKQTFDIYHA